MVLSKKEKKRKKKSNNLARFVKERHFGPLEVCSMGLSTTGNSMVPSKKKKKERKIEKKQ
jgi:hypothetical protein